MASLLLAGVVGLSIGFFLGVLCMALLAAADREQPIPMRAYAVRAVRPAPSLAVVRPTRAFPEEAARARAQEYA